MKNLLDKLRDVGNKTILGVGPVSKVTTDVALDLSKWKKIPIWLIPSRRQVECASLGGGYVNGWSTEEFSKYIRERDMDGLVTLVRDHGGPKQGKTYSDDKEDYSSAITSFNADIDSGFDVLHIDLSNSDLSTMSSVLIDLYKKDKENTLYEVNIDKHSAHLTNVRNFEAWLNDLLPNCNNAKFIAGNTGLFVYEGKNTNLLDQKTLNGLLELANKTNTIYMQHNVDYVRDEIFVELNAAGVKIANVAPEYGLVETKAMLDYMDMFGLDIEKKQFISIVANSNKWVKWFSHVGNASDLDKCLVSGHYHFSHPFVVDLRKKYPQMEHVCYNKVQERMCHHLKLLGW